MKKLRSYTLKSIYVVSLLFVFINCGGTHGSIKGYSFNISKYDLELQIKNIVEKESSLSFVENDRGDKYFYLRIFTDREYIFVVRYYGDKEFWDKNSNNSEIFIAYVKVRDEMYMTKKKLSRREINRYTKIFEEMFISKLKFHSPSRADMLSVHSKH